MELIIQATETGPFGVFLSVGIVLMVVGIILAVATDFEAVFVSGIIMLIGFSGVAFSLFTDSKAGEQAQESFVVAAAEQFNIKNPTPLEDDEVMGECRTGGESAVSKYLWLDEDGEFVEGLVMRGPEQNGECAFTLRAAS